MKHILVEGVFVSLLTIMTLGCPTAFGEMDNPKDPASGSYIGTPKHPLPEDNSVVNTVTPLFNWEDISNAVNYRLQVSLSENFNTTIIDTTVTASQYQATAGLLSNGSIYYWRVCAKNSAAQWGEWSATWRFSVNLSLQVPVEPTPTSGSTILDTTPLLDWEDISLAAKYQIQVSTFQDFHTTLVDSETVMSQFEVSTVLENKATYYWRVRIKDADNIFGEWNNPPWTFTVDIGVPTSPNPPDGSTITDTTPLLVWSDMPGAAGYHIQVNTNNTFTGTVIVDDSSLISPQRQVSSPLTTGTYYWRVKMRNTDGVWGDWSETWMLTIVDLKWTYPIGQSIYTWIAIGSEGTLYVGSADKILYAINNNGTFRWSYSTESPIWTSGPTIGSDDTIYVGSGNKLYAVNPNGTQRWVYTIGSSISDSHPAVGSDGTIYVGANDSKLYAINSGGTLRWTYTTGGHLEQNSPVIGSDGTIYIGSSHDIFYAINSNGTLRWTYTTGVCITSPAIGSDGTIYVGAHPGKLFALNPNGTLRWVYENFGDTFFNGPVIGPGNVIYVGSRDDKLYAINSNGTLRWSFTTGGNVCSPAIDSNGKIYIGSDDGNIYAISPEGTELWSYWIDGPVCSLSIGSDGTVYVWSYDGNMYAVSSNSSGLADSPWPMFRGNARLTGKAE